MLNQFYSYLSGKIIDFFRINSLIPGAKYNIQFETEDQVRELFNTLEGSTISKVYEYKDTNGEVKYRSFLLDFDSVKLVVAATIDNVQPDFLTRLRNMVGVESGYEDKAILFIHNTTLDSIMGGTESFSKEGMPFHSSSIEKDINNKLNDSSFTDVDKEIIRLDLDRKKNESFLDSSSIFEYKELLNIVNSTCIEKEQYRDFGLFFDSKLHEFSGKDLKKRLKENAEYFSRVDEIHNYGNPEIQLEKYFDEKGIEKLTKEDWKQVDYKDVKKSVEAKKEIKPLEYSNECKCSVKAWEKEEGSSKAKSRIRNIIAFNESGHEEVKMEFLFDDFIKKEFLAMDGDGKAVTSGKKIQADLYVNQGKPNFYKITYKNDKNVKFEFKIIVVNCSEGYFEGIKTKYSLVFKGKKNRYISVNTNDSEIVFNEFAGVNVLKELERNNEIVSVLDDEKVTVKISDNFDIEEDSDLITFNLQIGEEQIPFGIKGISEKVAPIEGLKVWKLKREKESDFKYAGNNKLQHGTKEYFARDDFRRNIELEKQIIEIGAMHYKEYTEGLEALDLEVEQSVRDSYARVIEYYRTANKIPSLTYLNDDLIRLYSNYIKAFVNALEIIEEGAYLSKSQKNLFKLGLIKREIEDREIMLTPLHPINIAYQLSINNRIGREELDEEILKKLTSTYLLPYIMDEDNKLYIPMEQYHSPEWKYYVDQNLPRYKGSRDFVSKLVTEKIEEFIGHFRYLFDMGNRAPLKLNLMNTGDSKEILQGIFSFYVKQLKSSQGVNEKLTPIEVYIYSDKSITNAFEEMAFNDDIESIKEIFKLNLNVDNMSEEDVLNLYRENVHFYSKRIDDGVEYAHITFLEMDSDTNTITSKMDDIPSGVMMNGLVSGLPSVFLGDAYRTGFGTKHTNTDNDIMKISMNLNALNAVISGEPFNEIQCKAISVPNRSKDKLELIYNSSHWVTFINPKVDLNFFKNDPDAKDLLIIHYSDQYTTAGGYDAITVTRKSIPYQRVIEEFLTKKDVENAEAYSPNIINMFNAINGDWLLRLLSKKSQFPREKISILSAVKLALAYFKSKNITWIPISLEEVLRVSGGAGLKQSEGIFSAKNLGFNGATSDDILLVGIEDINGDVKVHFYPVEVKIGKNENNYIEKGIEQAKATKKIFNETLLPKVGEELTYTQKVYRNFLMQLAITSAEKLKLYNVCNELNWSKITNTDIRRKLLNEEYEISNELIEGMGEAAVISFKSGISFKDIRNEDGVLIVEFTEEDGINYITKEISDIRELIGERKEVNFELPIENNDPVDSVENGTAEATDINVNPNPVEYVPPVEDKPVVPPTVNPIVAETPATYGNMEILFGFNQNNNKEVKWYPNDTNKVFHTNTGIIGTMGTGKTQFTKSVITQIHRESKNNVDGKDIGILIFDYKGDYNATKQDFIEATNANVYELYHLPFNPLSVVKSANSKPMLPLHTANSLKETLAKAFGLGIKQETLLRDLIMEAYEKRGIIKNKPDTWDNPAPTLKDVYDIYVNREDLKEDSLYAAFSNLIDFEIFQPDPHETKSLFELIDGVTVIDLSGYDPGIQNLVVAITLDLFYAQMQANGHSKIDGHLRQLNKVILVDEADNFLSKNFASLKKILKEGREFGVGTILSTQLLSHFSTGENDYANYILTWVVHSVADLSTKDVKYIFNTQSKSDDEMIYSKIKDLQKHYSLVKMGDSNKPVYMKDRAFWELIK